MQTIAPVVIGAGGIHDEVVTLIRPVVALVVLLDILAIILLLIVTVPVPALLIP